MRQSRRPLRRRQIKAQRRPLGSTVALINNTHTITDTFSYFPSGTVASRTGTTATPFQFVGTKGYHADASGKTYVRARVLEPQKGRWLTEDPIGFMGRDWNLYRYVRAIPTAITDPSGLIPCWLCQQLGMTESIGYCMQHCTGTKTPTGPPDSPASCPVVPPGFEILNPPNVTPRTKNIPWSTCYTFCAAFLYIGPLTNWISFICDPMCRRLCDKQTSVHSKAETCHNLRGDSCRECCESVLGLGTASVFCERGCRE